MDHYETNDYLTDIENSGFQSLSFDEKVNLLETSLEQYTKDLQPINYYHFMKIQYCLLSKNNWI